MRRYHCLILLLIWQGNQLGMIVSILVMSPRVYGGDILFLHPFLPLLPLVVVVVLVLQHFKLVSVR